MPAADADHGTTRDFARRMQARIIKAGNDIGIDAQPLALADFLQHAGNSQRLIGPAFDTDRRIDRVCSGNLRIRLPDAQGALERLRRHRGG